MIFGTNVQKVYLGESEVNKLLLQNIEIYSADPWSSVLNSVYSSNIIAAYDFREINGTTLTGKRGPSLILNNIGTNTNGGTFVYGSSNAISNSTVSLTYPHTLVFVARGDAGGGQLNYMSMSENVNNDNPQVAFFSRSNQSIMPYNGFDSQLTGYLPNNTEWFYVAASFLNNGTVRYAVRAASNNLNGVVEGSNGNSGFAAYPLFGKWFGNNWALPGTVRLAASINQGFSTQQEMDTLFNTFRTGPISDLF